MADIADRVVVMYAGRKVEEAPVHELFAQPEHQYTIGLLDAIPRSRRARRHGRLREIPGRVPSLAELPDEVSFAPRCVRADALCVAAVPRSAVSVDRHIAACVHPGRAA